MADTKKVAPKQSREYKTKTLSQVVVAFVALFGFDVDPEQLAAMLAGIEAGYLLIRRFFKREAVTA